MTFVTYMLTGLALSLAGWVLISVLLNLITATTSHKEPIHETMAGTSGSFGKMLVMILPICALVFFVREGISGVGLAFLPVWGWLFVVTAVIFIIAVLARAINMD